MSEANSATTPSTATQEYFCCCPSWTLRTGMVQFKILILQQCVIFVLQRQLIVIIENMKIILSFILIAFVLAQINSPSGGYTTYKDVQSQQFKVVKSFLFKQRPEVQSYKLNWVGRQLVNGLNYMIVLAPPAYNCSATAIIYTAFGNARIDLNSFNNTCESVLLPENSANMGGGFQVMNNPSGKQYENALSQALIENPQYTANDVIKVQTQVASGKNYRFTFKNKDKTTSVAIVSVPLSPSYKGSTYNNGSTTMVGSSPNPSPSLRVENPSPNRGYTDITNKKQIYGDALKAITAKYPSMNSYSIALVLSQEAQGRNFIFNFTDIRYPNCVRKAQFYVFIDPNPKKQSTITQLLNVDVCNYSAAQIAQAISDSAVFYPQLSGFDLKEVSNIWNSWGLQLKYSGNGNMSHTVLIFTMNKQKYHLIK